jgi:hypothetical protein
MSAMTTHTGHVRIGRIHGVGARRRPTPCTTSRNPLARAYAQRLLEVLTGKRPQEQLLAFATEDVYDRVRTLRALGCLHAGGSRPVLQRVFDSAPRQDALEVTALIRVGSGRRPSPSGWSAEP